MPKERYQTRLSDDRAERVDKYVQDHDISQSEGVRRLILAGLEAETETDDSDETVLRAGQTAGGLMDTVETTLLLVLIGVHFV